MPRSNFPFIAPARCPFIGVVILALCAALLSAQPQSAAAADDFGAVKAEKAKPDKAKKNKKGKGEREAGDKPNFVVINIDDLGYADIAPFGSKINRTPNLDRMASEGRKLTCYYAAPVCSPSRSALMTGCYPKRVLPIPGVLFPADKNGLNPDELTVAELLKGEGYATGMVGKWHLGDQPEWLPTKQGFDSYFGLPYSNDMGPGEDGIKSDLNAPIPAEKANLGEKGQPPLPLVRNDTVVKRIRADDQRTLVQLYAGEAVKFIKKNRKHPFFLYLSPSAVHFPIYPSRAFAGGNKHGYYSDWVEEADWMVGEVLYAIKDLELNKNTLVLFTSDNGGTRQRAINTPLRGFKTTTFEGGMRVPTIAWWPGKIPAGTSSDQVVGMMDVMPTFVKLAGGQAPTDRKIDGGDMWPVLSGDTDAKSPHETYYFYNGLKLEAVRNGPWKLFLAKKELYNLEADIGESKDVASQNEDVVEKLMELADKMKDDLGLTGIGPGCRPMAVAEKPKPIIGYDDAVRGDLKSMPAEEGKRK